MYHADNPVLEGDQMGIPVWNQDGRLIAADMHFYAILHASEAPYTDPANDVDDYLQPKVTDCYSEPLVGLSDEYGSSNADRPLLFDRIAGSSAIVNPTEGAYANTFHQKSNESLLILCGQ